MRVARSHELKGEPQRHRPRAQSRWRMADYIVPAVVSIAFLFYARPFVLPLVIASVAGMVLQPAVGWLIRRHVPPFLAAAILAVVLLTAAGGFIYYFAQPAMQWIKRAPGAALDMKQKLETTLHLPWSTPASPEPDKEISKPAPLQMPDTQMLSTILTWTGTTLAGVVEAIVLLYLILVSNGWFSRKLAEMLSSHYERPWVIESLDKLQREMSRYMLSITFINVVFGLLLAAGLAIVGLPNAPMWGGLAALLNYIPYFGPVFGMIIVGIVGILTFNTFPKEILPLAFYLGMHLLEADLVTPLFLGQRFTIHPLVIFISLLFWTWVWGVPGAFLSGPMLVALKVASDRLPALASWGELLKK